MKSYKTSIPGCYELHYHSHLDNRGKFVKIFNKEIFNKHNLHTRFFEDYYSLSKKNVIRGMHFQIPPHDHFKLVTCLYGCIEDVIVDIRKGSPSYKKTFSITISSDQANAVLLSPGLAHGFCTLSEQAIVLYKVSSNYNPDCDSGIHWQSCNFQWPTASAIVSERDNKFPTLDEFESPFIYE